MSVRVRLQVDELYLDIARPFAVKSAEREVVRCWSADGRIAFPDKAAAIACVSHAIIDPPMTAYECPYRDNTIMAGNGHWHTTMSAADLETVRTTVARLAAAELDFLTAEVLVLQMARRR